MILPAPLDRARALGADPALNVSGTDTLAPYQENKGYLDVVVEASGTQPALLSALSVVRPRGVVVQLGLGGDAMVPMNTVVTKEIDLVGSFRFHEEFSWAAQLIRDERVNLVPVLSDVFPVVGALTAFEHANDRTRAMKVQIAFG
ncbi:MAG: zinc-binding dehydrogenase [Chromatiales bacterium]|nr:zinc-binding dehydrogenase [Chromatiales bacterium]